MTLPLTRDEMKLICGELIWLIPLYNSKLRGVPLDKQIKSAVLQKVGTKNFTLKDIGTFSLHTHCNDSNFGFIPFKTQQCAMDYLEIKDFAFYLKTQTFHNLSIDQVHKIKKILGEN